jgi:hypothetical protein
MIGRPVDHGYRDARPCRRNGVQLSQCPYDRSPIQAEVCSGGSLLLKCECCGAEWEWHGAWLRRLQEPDREAVRNAREAGATPEPAS